MADEVKNPAETGKVEKNTAENYIATIKELKENTVDRKKYEEVVAENKRILGLYVDGQGDDKQVQTEVVPTVDELREDLFGPKGEGRLNLDFAQKALLLRKQLMDKGEPDPF